MKITGVEYKTEWDESDDLSAEEHTEKCCGENKPGIQCGKTGKVEVWNVGAEQDDWPESTKELIIKAKYDPLLEVRYVARERPCGLKETKWEFDDCCDGSEPSLYWIQAYGAVEWNEKYLFKVGGGKGPYSWSVEGKGLDIGGNGQNATLYVSDCFCNPGVVTCTDVCGQTIKSTVTSEEGSWVPIEESEWPAGLVVPGVSGGLNIAVTGQNDKYKVSQRWANGTVYEGTITGGVPHIEWACSKVGANPRYTKFVDPTVLFEGYQNCPESDTIYTTDVVAPMTVKYAYPIEVQLAFWKWECPDSDELIYDDENSVEVINDDSANFIYWDGGKPPFTVSLEGIGFFVDPGRTLKEVLTSRRYLAIHTADACGGCQVTITDKCNDTVTGSLRSTDGNWVAYSGSPDVCPFKAYTDNYNLNEAIVGDTKIRQYINYGINVANYYKNTESEAVTYCSNIVDDYDPSFESCFYEYGDARITLPGNCVVQPLSGAIQKTVDAGKHVSIGYSSYTLQYTIHVEYVQPGSATYYKWEC